MTVPSLYWAIAVIAALASGAVESDDQVNTDVSPCNPTGDMADLHDVVVQSYGIRVRVPTSWRQVGQPHDERAFLFEVTGGADTEICYVACELGIVPAGLDEFQRRHQLADQREKQRQPPRRKLISNELYEWASEPVDMPPDLERARLDCQWRYAANADTPEVVERRSYLVRHGSLYTFIFTGPAAAFEAGLASFEAMLRSARFAPADTGLQRLPDGYWMQREYRFAMKLPDEWRPAFAPVDQALFFATGPTEEVFTDNLIVLASPSHPLDLEHIRQTFPDELRAVDGNVEIEHCEVVKQGDADALETLIHTKQGPFRITILERRFQAGRRNYEVRFTSTSDGFKAHRESLYQSLESFRELAEDTSKPADL